MAVEAQRAGKCWSEDWMSWLTGTAPVHGPQKPTAGVMSGILGPESGDAGGAFSPASNDAPSCSLWDVGCYSDRMELEGNGDDEATMDWEDLSI